MASLQEKIAQLGGFLGNTLTSMGDFLKGLGIGTAAGGQPGENLSLRNPFLSINPQIILNFGDKTSDDLKIDIESALGLTEGSLEQQDLGELFGALQQEYPDTFVQVISALTGASTIDVGVALFNWAKEQAVKHFGLDGVPTTADSNYNEFIAEVAAIAQGQVTDVGQAWIEAQAAEEDLLAEDEDLLGTADVFVQVEEGAEDGDPFFEPRTDIESEFPEQVIDFETDPLPPVRPVTFEDSAEEAGGGGATDATEAADTGEAADAADEAVEATDEAVEATDEATEATQTDITSTTDEAGDGGMLTTGGEVTTEQQQEVTDNDLIVLRQLIEATEAEEDEELKIKLLQEARDYAEYLGGPAEGTLEELKDWAGEAPEPLTEEQQQQIYDEQNPWIYEGEGVFRNIFTGDIFRTSSDVYMDVGGRISEEGKQELEPAKEEDTQEDVIDIFLPTGTEDTTAPTEVVTTAPTEVVTTAPTEVVTTAPTEVVTTDTGQVATGTGDTTTAVTTVGAGEGTGVSDTGTGEGGDAGAGAGDAGDTTTVGTGAGTEGTGDEGTGVEGIGTDGTGEGAGGDGTGDGTGGGAPVSAGGMFSPKPFQGYMGGLSYQLPEFVGVYYQPKDYDTELNRIIQQSLFQGMY